MPVNVQAVPPAVPPLVGLMADSVGADGGDTYVYDTEPLVPLGVVAVTLTAPAAWAGQVQRTCVLLTTLMPVPAEPLNDTPVQPVR